MSGTPNQPHHQSDPHHQTHTSQKKAKPDSSTRTNGRCRPESHQCLRQLSTPPTHSVGAGPWTTFAARMLLRKEVIQPHLPVRLPCYDFVPIASPTFDGSLPYGLGHRLRVLPTFVT